MSHTVITKRRFGIGELLLVDDEPTEALLAKEALRASGARLSMTVVSGGKEALSWLSDRADKGGTSHLILVLLDLNMPDWDGEATLQHIRLDPKTSLIPVMCLSTSDNEREVERAYRAGANGYVRKPFKLEDYTKFFASLDGFWGDYVVPPTWPLSKPFNTI